MAVSALAQRAGFLALVLGGASLCGAEGPITPPTVTAVRNPSAVLDSTANNATGTAGGSHTELDSAASAPGTSGAESSSDATQDDIPVLPVHEQRSDRFQWKPALAQYGLEISIQHAWRFVHENGTVDAVAYGPWFHDWIDSIGETRGWDDSDGWLDARDAAGNLWCQPRNAQATRA